MPFTNRRERKSKLFRGSWKRAWTEAESLVHSSGPPCTPTLPCGKLVLEMADFCTCGAQLPEDARFCHRCGKPQRNETFAVEPTPEIVEIPAVASANPSFHHP